MRAKELLIVETQQLNEIDMSPKGLQQLASAIDARAGMEFEMIVPGVHDDDSEPEWEADYDRDQLTRSFDDIESFFHDGDYNGRREVANLIEEIQNEYQEWQYEQIGEAWSSNGLEFVRDYVANNDLFDRADAMDEARDQVMDANPDLPSESQDFQQLISARLDEMERQFAEREFEDQGRIYDDAFTEFSDDQRDEYDERSFLGDKYPYMTDIENNFGIQWPHYIDINADNDGEMDIDQVADDFSNYMNKPVNASRSYHGARREPGKYVVEPDGSLSGDNPGDAGLEFVSPPMPVAELMSDLLKVKAWADREGCYTNDSTGLHINVSVPGLKGIGETLDYVKLALLLGDERVLNEFGRAGNTYAKSAVEIVKNRVTQHPEDAAALLTQMKGHMANMASKSIHSGITNKFTSINTKDGYIEFRSPGGDWLGANFELIVPTLLRFVVALDAAIDPNKYRQEYLKKLYKLLSPASPEDPLAYFAKFSAGELPKQALKSFVRQAQLQRKIVKDPTSGEKYWWSVGRPGYGASAEIVASSKEEAIAKGKMEYPDWANAMDMTARPLRPYQEPAGEAKSYTVTDASGYAMLFRATSPQAAEQMAKQQYPDKFRNVVSAVINDQATQAAGQFRSSENVPREGQPRGLVPTGPGPWQIYRRSDNTAVRELEHTNRAGAEAEAITALGLRGEAPELYGVRTRQTAGEPIPGSTIDLQRQRAAQAGGEFRGTWRIMIDGEEVHQFGGIGNNQGDANRIGRDWILQQIRSRQLQPAEGAEIEVLPVMEPE